MSASCHPRAFAQCAAASNAHSAARSRTAWPAFCRFTLLLIALVPYLHTSTTFAGPPFITDDPVPDDKGHGELYVGSIGTWNADGVAGDLPLIEGDYGIIDNVQLHFIASAAFNRPSPTGDMQYGYGDTELGVKYRFIQEDGLFKGCPQIGIFPLFEAPTGRQDRGLGNGVGQTFLPVWLQKSFGPDNRQWTIFGGGGYWINPGAGNHNWGFMGIVVQKQITDNFALGFELNHSTVSAVGQTEHTGFNLGTVYDFSDHWHLLLSAGRDIVGNNRLTFYSAIQFTF